ncbi:MAG: hypothetical protein ACPG4K_14605 [Haloferula sp.]
MREVLMAGLLTTAVWASEIEVGPLLPDGNFDATGVGIEEKHWDAYFGPDSGGALVDPQRMLSHLERKERLEFLQQHADDSRIELEVMLFQQDQRLPAALDELLADRLGVEEPTALLLYPMGEPDRAEMFFSHGLADKVAATETGRLVGQAAIPAKKKVGDLDEFNEFCLQMSIRLYWVERSLGWVDESSGEFPVVKPEPVQAVSRSELIKEAFRQAWQVGGLPLMVACSAFVSFSILRFLMRTRRRHRFPEFEIEPRLGGDHAAGIGAVISFGSTTQSPSVQKSQTVDYLGGI